MTYKLLSMFSDYRDIIKSIAEKRDLSHREQGKTRITSSSENKTRKQSITETLFTANKKLFSMIQLYRGDFY